MEVRVMRSANTILKVIRERGEQGLPMERVYRMLFNPEFYQRAYAKLYPNKGAMTQGSTSETVDGMSQAKIENIIEALRNERYQWTPVRRVDIPKPNGKKRSLGVTSWSDKLLQEVIRTILECYYEPQFSNHSHGFRPDRGCHTALTTIQQTWKGTRWFIEGDIAQYFDTIDHDKLIEILSEKIHDGRLLQLIRNLLKAGYLKDWKYNKTLSGAPQGGVLSPLLSNIYLDKFDQYVTTTLIPEYTKGKQREYSRAYGRVQQRIHSLKKRGIRQGVKALTKQLRTMPSRDPHDPGYRRLRYVRYADDTLFGYAGTKSEAEEMKRKIKEWLQDNLKLTLSEEKTLITHASSSAARFLGYDIVNQQEDNQLCEKRRSINGQLGMRVPVDVTEKKCAKYKRKTVARYRAELLAESDYTIVTTYQQEYRGIVQYYLLAYNVSDLHRLHWIMEQSLLKTLAAKHKTSSKRIREKYRTMITTPEGKALQGLQVIVNREGKKPLVATFGGISLTRQPLAIINDQPTHIWGGRTEILERLLANTCELCGSKEHVEVHHVRKLANLHKRGRKDRPEWVKQMITRKRKTLVVCRKCHNDIHAGRDPRGNIPKVSLESRVH
jgi:group II intron reverse transcriptase/maturase